MEYLNRSERRTLNAIGAYQPRRLTQIEQVIKHIKHVHTMPASNDQLRADKASEAFQAYRILEGLTSNEKLLERAQKAMYSTGDLIDLIESYPFVEFESVINNTQPLPAMVYAAYRGFTPEELRVVVEWRDRFIALTHELPTEFGENYIWTPRTHNAMLRQMAIDEKDVPAWGLFLRKDLQERVNELFKDVHVYNHPLRVFYDYNLIGVADLHERLKMDPPQPYTSGKARYAHTLKFWQKEAKPGSILERSVTSRVISVFRTDYPIESHADVKALFHFQY